MNKNRLEAFSDGVIAIIITIMVLELKVPHGADFSALLSVSPVFLSYVLSFTYVGIYWNNHHHMLQATSHTNGRILWANLHFLFWLSLFPVTTAWAGENNFAAATMTVYGIVLFMTSMAYRLLQQSIIKADCASSTLMDAIGRDRKGKVSPLLYGIGIATSFFAPWVSALIYAIVALLWLIPDRRIETAMQGQDEYPPTNR